MNVFTNKREIDKEYVKLSAKAEILYRFVMRYHDYIYGARDYGNGDPIKMVEVHTLTMIESNPGISVSELAQLWDRTKGTVSVNVTALEKKGYIYRKKEDGNAKVVHLYPTDKGIELSTLHKAYDNRDISGTQDALLQHCTPEELAAFYKVIRIYMDLFSSEN